MNLFLKNKNLYMKNLLFLLFLILLTNHSVVAQKQLKRQRIKALKISFITNSLDLTPNEAEKFWPIYNIHSNSIQSLKVSLENGIQRKIQIAGGIESLSEKQAENFILKMSNIEQQITDNQLKLINELSTVISFKKIIKLKKAQREFNRRILREYGRRRQLGKQRQ